VVVGIREGPLSIPVVTFLQAPHSNRSPNLTLTVSAMLQLVTDRQAGGIGLAKLISDYLDSLSDLRSCQQLEIRRRPISLKVTLQPIAYKSPLQQSKLSCMPVLL